METDKGMKHSTQINWVSRGLVVGFCGPAHVGKSTIASAMQERSLCRPSVILPFAGPLKQLARDYFGWDGTKDARGRKLLQMLGTDVGRWWAEDFWVKKWHEEAKAQCAKGTSVLVDDVRFQNEVDAIHSLGGFVVHLSHPTRGLSGLTGSDLARHASECQTLENIDYRLQLGNLSPSSAAVDVENAIRAWAVRQ